MTTTMGQEFFGGQHVFKSDGPQAIMDARRGTPGFMKQLISGYLDVREKYAQEWLVIEDLYRKDTQRIGGSPFADPLSLQGRMVMPPRVHSIVHGNESQLFVRNPKCYVNPMSARQERIAEILEAHLTAHWKRETALPGQIRLCLRDTGKVGFSFMATECFAENPRSEKLARKRRQKAALQLQEDAMSGEQLAQDVARMAMGVDSVNAPEQKGNYRRDSRIVYKRISHLRVPFWNIAMDPRATGPEDAEWIYEYQIVPLAAVKREPSFKNTSGLKATMSLRGRMAERARELNRNPAEDQTLEIPEEYQMVGIWSGFERNDDGGFDKKVFADDYDQWLFEEPDLYDMGHPYSMLRWNHDGDTLFAASDVGLVLDMISEEIQLRTRLFDSAMRRLNDTAFLDGDAVPESDLAVTVLPGVGKIVRLTNLRGKDINQVLTYPRKPEEASAIMPHLSLIQRDIEMGTGEGPNQQMMAMKSDTSATEAAVVEQRAKARSAVKDYWFSEFVADIGLKVCQLTGQYLGPDDIAQTAGFDAAAAWAMENWTSDDIRYGMAVTVEKGSMAPMDDDTRYQLYTEMVTEALTNPLAAIITNVPEAQRRRLLARGVQDGSSLLNPGVSAEAFSRASTQMALMKQGGGGGGSAPAEKPPRAEGAQAAQPNQKEGAAA